MLSNRQRKEEIMKKFNDKDIREALRRKENKRQRAEVPDDFLKNVLDAIEEEKQPKTFKLWRFVAAAAGLALLIGIGAAVFFFGENNQPEENLLAETDTVKFTQPKVEEVVSVENDEPPLKVEHPKKQPVKKQNLPVDEFWLENLRRSCGAINYEGNKYKYYKEVEELFNRLSDEQKATKIGKSIYLSLYGKAPATGDKINDYDLYDIKCGKATKRKLPVLQNSLN